MSRRLKLSVFAVSIASLVTLSACGSAAVNEAVNIEGQSISDETLDMAIAQHRLACGQSPFEALGLVIIALRHDRFLLFVASDHSGNRAMG